MDMELNCSTSKTRVRFRFVGIQCSANGVDDPLLHLILIREETWYNVHVVELLCGAHIKYRSLYLGGKMSRRPSGLTHTLLQVQ